MKYLPVTILAFVLEALLWQLTQLDVRRDVPQAIRLMIGASLVYLVAVAAVSLRKAAAHRVFVLIFAFVFRLTVAPAMPGLSDDILRYRWEGRVQSDGLNPYLTTPATAPRDATFTRTPTPNARAGYGPLTTLAERGAYEVARGLSADPARQAFWMKAPAVLAEATTLVLLSRVLPVEQLLFYAWCPAPVIEFWWNGHNDALALLAVVASLLLARGGRWTAAHLALGAAIACKWWPAVLWPMLVARTPEGRWRTAAMAPAVAAASCLLYWTPRWREYLDNVRYMSGYVGGWRNNDSLYGAFLALTGDQYRAKYLAFALLAAWVAWTIHRGWSLERGWLGAAAAMLLVSANAHPWYLTWLVTLGAFGPPWPPLLVWQLLTPLSYSVLIEWHARGVWAGSRPDRWWIYGPLFAAIAGWSIWSRKPAISATSRRSRY